MIFKEKAFLSFLYRQGSDLVRLKGLIQSEMTSFYPALESTVNLKNMKTTTNPALIHSPA